MVTLVGGEGYVPLDQVVPVLDFLQGSGYNWLRHRNHSSDFWAKTWTKESDYVLLDRVVDECEKRGMHCTLDTCHTFGPGTQVAARKTEWLAKTVLIFTRYRDRKNLSAEPLNEQTSGEVSLHNSMLYALRGAGVDLPYLAGLWWSQPNMKLVDPAKNWAIVRHFYGKTWNTWNCQTPTSLEYVMSQTSIDDAMTNYFRSTSNYYYQSAKTVAPLGLWATEMGPTDNETYTGAPSVGNIAYAMQFNRESIAYGAPVCCYMIGEDEHLSLYQQRALQWFNESYNPLPAEVTYRMLTKNTGTGKLHYKIIADEGDLLAGEEKDVPLEKGKKVEWSTVPEA